MKIFDNANDFIRQGFKVLKIKGGINVDEDIERLIKTREAVGKSIEIRFDANQGYSVEESIRFVKETQKVKVELLEQPAPYDELGKMAQVTSKTNIPIMADESVFDHHDAFRLASMGACDYFNIKFSKSGGICNALKIVALAEAAGIKCQVGCMSESRFALSALMHLVLARDTIVHYDMDSSLMLDADPVTGGIEYQGAGLWTIGESPGIGAGFDEAFLETMDKFTIS